MSGLIVGIVFSWLIAGLFVLLGTWLGFQLVHQNGRLLSHLEGIEQRLAALAARPHPGQAPAPGLPAPAPAIQNPNAQRAPEIQNSGGLPLGSPAPEFALPDLSGKRHSLADFRGRKLLLLFFNPGCGFCTRMAADLAALPVDGSRGRPLPLVVTTGGVEENRKLVEEYGIRCPVLLQEPGTHGVGGEVGARYQCNGTPMGYVIDEQGKIASELAIGGPPLLALANTPAAPSTGNGHAPDADGGVPAAGTLGGKRSVEESKIARDGLPAGTPAPDFTLPLLHGGELSLSEYQGRKVLLVFSDPKCGPCDQLAPQLEQLHRRTPGIQVLMISRGEAEANRVKAAQHGLTFPILLQQQWEISREYAKFATPIGYLIDEEGIIAREVAIGVEPILALLSAPAIAPSNGKGKLPHRGKELARRR
jgi:peroxiredoxin